MKCLLAILMFWSLSAHAQVPTPQPTPEAHHPLVDSKSSVHINYGSSDWNKDPKEIDTASIIMREGATGRTVQISLVETEPDSSLFSGLYSLNWQNLDKLQLEFYIPPQDLVKTNEGMKKIQAMIADKSLKRSPFIFRRLEGQQLIEIFDTKDQAQEAMKSYRAEQLLLNKARGTSQLLTEQEAATAHLANQLEIDKYLLKAAADRIRLAQVETKKRTDLQVAQTRLSTVEKAKRQKQAAELAAQGLQLFKTDHFNEAREKYEQAIALDPFNDSFYFQYGVTYYRLDDFNRSIVLLKLAEGSVANPTENDYFLGLDYFRIKDYAEAAKHFKVVADSSDAELSGSSRFYLGVMAFEQKQWTDAEKSFQTVLDTSKDPKLDERAQSYIEQSLRYKQFEEEANKKWTLSFTIGEIYDSNVLLISDSQVDTGTATNNAGWRTLATGSLRYRPIYDETHEFAAQLDVVSMYTLDTSGQYSTSLHNADPYVATFTAPWTYKGLMFGKGYKLDIIPGYETTVMSIEDNTSKPILDSYLLKFENLFVMNPKWFANYNLEFRQDNSLLDSSTGVNNATALNIKLASPNLIFLTEDKSKILTAEVDLTDNEAVGSYTSYERVDLSVGYIQPAFWNTSATVKLGYFNINYAQNPDGRVDNSYTLSTGLSKKLSDVWSTGLLLSYNINDSTLAADQYTKWTGLLTLSAVVGL